MTGPILWVMFGLVLWAAVALAVLILADRSRRRHLARLTRARAAMPAGTPAAAAPPARRAAAPGLRALAGLDRRLRRSALPVTLRELMVQLALAMLGLYAAAVLLAGLHPLTAIPVAVGLPWLTAEAVIARARRRYVAGFTAGLPEALDVFSRGLRAGRPVADSLSIVVDNSGGPVAVEFARCRDEIALGTALPTSLDRLSARMETPEVAFFATATALQSETGGNLIETMEGLARQLRERRKLRGKARALSSEARASAVILAALPFAVTLLLLALNAGYLSPLWADPRGRAMALTGLASVGLGIVVMMRMGRIDV